MLEQQFSDFDFCLGKNLQNFLAVVGVEEDDSGTSMLPASAMLENCSFSALSGMEYTFFD